MSQKLMWLKAIHAAENLSPAAKNIAVALFMHHNAKTGLCCVKQATLGDDVALKRGRVNRVVRELKDAGWITAEQTMGASYYILNVEGAGSRESVELCRNEDTSDETSYVGSDTPSVSDPAQQVCPTLHTEQSTLTVSPNRLSLRAPAGTKPRRQTNASGGARVRSKKSEGTPWPDDLDLDDAARQAAHEAGITQDIERLWSRFRNHALDKAQTSHNWPSAWRNWCETAYDHRKRDAARQSAAREQPKLSRFQIPRNGA